MANFRQTLGPRTGIRLFFFNVTHHFMVLIILNLMFVVCSIPVVTIGASLAALNRVCSQMADGQPMLYVAKEFWDAFRQNFKQGLAAGAVAAVYLGALYYAFRVLDFVRSTSLILRVILLVAAVVFAMVALYVFPQIGMLRLTLRQIFNNAVRLTLLRLGPSLCAVLLGGAVLLGPLWFWPMSLLLYLVLLVSLSALICCSITWPLIRANLVKDEAQEECNEPKLK
jgi:uncharacterized membrane protein YesL